MQISNRMMTVGTTLFLAVATGHIMQNEDVIGAKLHQLGRQYTELASAFEKRTNVSPIIANPTVPKQMAVDHIDPERAQISVGGGDGLAAGVLVAASMDPNSKILPDDQSRGEGGSPARAGK